MVKDIVFRASNRLNLPVMLVANKRLAKHDTNLIKSVVVPEGFDVADDYIAERSLPQDLVITADIPLAARIVAKGGTALNPRGELYTEDNIGERLAMRDLMMELRDGGVVAGGPAQFGPADRQRFASALDRLLTRFVRSTPLPRISVLMPVRNEERYLQAALDSLHRQSLTEWELVAVDDGSTDATPAILAAAAQKDRRIRLIRLEGGGLVAALNAGLEACRAPLLARMDGDDICHPRRFERQADYLETHPDVGLVASSFRHFPRTGLRRGMVDYERWQNSLQSHALICRDLFVESPFVHPGIMTRRAIVQRLGGYRDCGWAEDYDLWLRMAGEGVRFARLADPLFFWRDHPERATRTMDAYAAHAMRCCKLHHLRRTFLDGVAEVVMGGAGREARAWQRLLSAQGIRVTHWLDIDPRKIGRTLHEAPVLHPSQMKLAGRKMIVAIGLRGARDQFRLDAQKLGWREGVEFTCVA